MTKLFLNLEVELKNYSKLLKGVARAINMEPMVNPLYRRVISVTNLKETYRIRVIDYANTKDPLTQKFDTREYKLEDLIRA